MTALEEAGVSGAERGGGGGTSGRSDCQIIHGDTAEALSALPDRSVKCVCTDPPYGVGVARQYWDRRMPGAAVWRECVRVMEPGAFAFVMCSPRQDIAARMVVALEDAGLNMSFPPVLWTYPTGFSPAKSARYIAKRFRRGQGGGGKNSGSALACMGPDADGSYMGYVPRPAVELALVGMRPPENGKALIDQYAENGLGVTHLDDCRIPYAGRDDVPMAGYYVPVTDDAPPPPGSVLSRDGTKARILGSVDERGRFPSNLLCSGGALDDGRRHGKSGTYSRFFDLDAWASEHMALAVTAAPKPRIGERNCGLDGGQVDPMPISKRGDDGDASAAAGDGAAAETPYNRSARARRNNHPTVKPIALFAYLLHLGSRPGDTVLDPFVGSGTSMLAAKMTGRDGIGIERERRYVEIARLRVKNYAMNVRMEAFR